MGFPHPICRHRFRAPANVHGHPIVLRVKRPGDIAAPGALQVTLAAAKEGHEKVIADRLKAWWGRK